MSFNGIHTSTIYVFIRNNPVGHWKRPVPQQAGRGLGLGGIDGDDLSHLDRWENISSIECLSLDFPLPCHPFLLRQFERQREMSEKTVSSIPPADNLGILQCHSLSMKKDTYKISTLPTTRRTRPPLHLVFFGISLYFSRIMYIYFSDYIPTIFGISSAVIGRGGFDHVL